MTKRILYIEDNYMNFLLVKKILHDQDLIVERAENASAALDKLRVTRPDLILMDIHLPGMDGIELSAVIRQDKAMATVPIIGISASSIPQDRIDAVKAGFSFFNEKPLDIKRLVETVSKILEIEKK
jgi:CheY-like chemotaxis protein